MDALSQVHSLTILLIMTAASGHFLWLHTASNQVQISHMVFRSWALWDKMFAKLTSPSCKRASLLWGLLSSTGWRRQWWPTPVFCLENPRDRGACGLPPMGSHRRGQGCSDVAAAAVPNWRLPPAGRRLPSNVHSFWQALYTPRWSRGPHRGPRSPPVQIALLLSFPSVDPTLAADCVMAVAQTHLSQLMWLCSHDFPSQSLLRIFVCDRRPRTAC